eukprot:2084462-Ditylum_brightwellii.AAC.1
MSPELIPFIKQSGYQELDNILYTDHRVLHPSRQIKSKDPENINIYIDTTWTNLQNNMFWKNLFLLNTSNREDHKIAETLHHLLPQAVQIAQKLARTDGENGGHYLLHKKGTKYSCYILI